MSTTTTTSTTTVPGFTPLILSQDSSSNASWGILLKPSFTYSFVIDWGDGQTQSVTGQRDNAVGVDPDGYLNHGYSSTGVYDVTITSQLPFALNDISGVENGYRSRVTEVKQWGNCPWATFESAFFSHTNLQITATDIPNLSQCVSFDNAFNSCYVLTGGNIGSWDIGSSSATSSAFMFGDTTALNANLNNWDVSKIENFSSMFFFSGYNQPLGNWNVCSATNMTNMFLGAGSFDQDISTWKVPGIPVKPSGFDDGGTPMTWTTGEKPQWGAACEAVSPTPTVTPTNTPTNTETSTPTPTSSEVLAASVTPSVTPTNTPTNTETPTNTSTTTTSTTTLAPSENLLNCYVYYNNSTGTDKSLLTHNFYFYENWVVSSTYSGYSYSFGQKPTGLTAYDSFIINSTGSSTFSYFTISVFTYSGDIFTIYATTNQPTKGYNSVDALKIARYFTGGLTFSETQKKVADVNATGIVNSTDGLRIQQRFVKLSSTFAKGDWALFPMTFSLSELAATSSGYILTITISCVGDVG
jgi:hypothetical protein